MDARAPMAAPVDPHAADWAAALIEQRRTVLPKRLLAPGPDAAQTQRILAAAAAAPDHGELLPWRFVIVPEGARGRLADVFAASLKERDASATEEQMAQAREKAHRAPLLLLAVAKTLGEPADIPAAERLVSAGCAIQNLLLMATAFGFGSALTSGKALNFSGLRELFALGADEEALCFISIGTVSEAKRGRTRPSPDRYVSELESKP